MNKKKLYIKIIIQLNNNMYKYIMNKLYLII